MDLPHPTWLRTFEAAARLSSFSAAADELGLTPAAVSQQIKQLETYLGIALFRRMTRAVQLTEEARTVLPLVTEGFDKLAEAGVTPETAPLVAAAGADVLVAGSAVYAGADAADYARRIGAIRAAGEAARQE